MNLKQTLIFLMSVATLGACTGANNPSSLLSDVNSNGYDPFVSAAAAVVACIEAGEGKMIQTDFDETGECENGVNIWQSPSTNPSIVSRVISSTGDDYEGEKIGTVRFNLNHNLKNQVCGFNMVVNSSQEDVLLFVDSLKCSPRVLLPKELTLKIESIECGEIDPYEVGDACVVTGKNKDGDAFVLAGSDYDLLTRYSYEELEGLNGRSITVKSSGLSQIGEPGAIEELKGFSGEGYYFWWDSAWTLHSQSKFYCDGLGGTDEWTMYVDLEKGKAGFFDNDTTIVIPLYADETNFEVTPPVTTYIFLGEDTGGNEDSLLKITYSPTSNKGSVTFDAGGAEEKTIYPENVCVADEDIELDE